MDSKGSLIHFWRMSPSVPIKYGGFDTTPGSQSSFGWQKLEDIPGKVQDLLVSVKCTIS